MIPSSSTLANNLRYTGREFDTETSLYYYRARYYDPQAGRFISEDPIGFEGGPNFYNYVDNDPTDYEVYLAGDSRAPWIPVARIVN